MRVLLATEQRDIGQWVRDYGAVVAALLALAVSIFNALFSVGAARRSKRGEWRRETRLPVYLNFARAVEELKAEADLQWENAFGGPGLEDRRSSPRPLDDCHRDVWRTLADVELVGPPDLAESARSLADAAATYRWAMVNPAGGGDHQAVGAAFEKFRKAARSATDLPT